MRFLWILVLFLSVANSDAARIATIEVEEAMVLSQPNADSQNIGRLTKGTKVAVSNEPTKGFHKVRTPSGKIGWIIADSISLGPISEKGAQKKSKAQYKLPSFNSAAIELFGGLAYFTMPELAAATSIELGPGLYYGGSFQFYISESLMLGLRLEYLSASSTFIDEFFNITYSVTGSSFPVYLGLISETKLSKSVSMLLQGYGGLGFGSNFSATATSTKAPNTTTYRSTALGLLGIFTLSLGLSDSFSIFGEAGYRYLNTQGLVASEEGNGSEIFKENGEFDAIPVNFSGPFGGLGLRFGL